MGSGRFWGVLGGFWWRFWGVCDGYGGYILSGVLGKFWGVLVGSERVLKGFWEVMGTSGWSGTCFCQGVAVYSKWAAVGGGFWGPGEPMRAQESPGEPRGELCC